MKPLYKAMMALVLATCTPSLAATNADFEAIRADAVTITYKGGTTFTYEFGEMLEPADFCRVLGELLNAPQSNTFPKPFVSVNCLGASSQNALRTGQWRIEIDAQSSTIRLRLLFQGQDALSPQEQAVVIFPANAKLDEQNLQLVVTELFDQSPMLARVADTPDFSATKTTTVKFPCRGPRTLNPPSPRC